LKGRLIMNQMIQFDNFDVKVDGNGRYSLNDLHKITGGKKNDGPSYWLQTAQAQKLISELVLTTGFPVVKKTEGRYGGTYAVKYVAPIAEKMEEAVKKGTAPL